MDELDALTAVDSAAGNAMEDGELAALCQQFEAQVYRYQFVPSEIIVKCQLLHTAVAAAHQ